MCFQQPTGQLRLSFHQSAMANIIYIFLRFLWLLHRDWIGRQLCSFSKQVSLTFESTSLAPACEAWSSLSAANPSTINSVKGDPTGTLEGSKVRDREAVNRLATFLPAWSRNTHLQPRRKVDFSFLCIPRASFIWSLQRYLHLISSASFSQMWISGLLRPHQDRGFNSANSIFFLSVLDNKNNDLMHVQLHPLKGKQYLKKEWSRCV